MTLPNESGKLTAASLRLVACFTMLIDHIGAALFPQATLLRLVGRIAMPIFCFQITEGARHTRNRGRYLLRLLLCGVLSELPFNMVVSGTVFDPQHQNVLWTLSLGLAAIFACDEIRKKCPGRGGVLLCLLPWLGACVFAEGLLTDYGCLGILMIASFAYLRNRPALLVAALAVIAGPGVMIRDGFFGVPLEIFALLAFFFLFRYNGKRGAGGKAVQVFFYAFYPVHLLILGLLRLFLA